MTRPKYLITTKYAFAFYSLLKQCEACGVKIRNELEYKDSENTIVVDALFGKLSTLLGFGFEGPFRSPYNDAIDQVRRAKHLVSIDVPSGWNVNDGPSEESLSPETLISLMCPKNCSRFFKGQHHILAGRFINIESLIKLITRNDDEFELASKMYAKFGNEALYCYL